MDLRDGRARGGGGRAYVDTYLQLDNRFTAELSVTQHRHTSGVETTLGLSDVLIQQEGSCDDRSMEARGSSRDSPRMLFNVGLTMIVD